MSFRVKLNYKETSRQETTYVKSDTDQPQLVEALHCIRSSESTWLQSNITGVPHQCDITLYANTDEAIQTIANALENKGVDFQITPADERAQINPLFELPSLPENISAELESSNKSDLISTALENSTANTKVSISTNAKGFAVVLDALETANLISPDFAKEPKILADHWHASEKPFPSHSQRAAASKRFKAELGAER